MSGEAETTATGLKEAIAQLETRDVHTGYDSGGNFIWEDYISRSDVLALLPSASVGGEREAGRALASVYANARFRWLGRDCCIAVERALKAVREDLPVQAEKLGPSAQIDDFAGLRESITDDQFESLFVALHRVKCNPTMDEIALVMPEVAAIFALAAPETPPTEGEGK